MKTKIILNPYANRWGAKTRAAAVERAFHRAGLHFDLSYTNGAREAISTARAAVASGYDAVVAAGGDGTVHEVVNGLISATEEGPTIPLGVVPIGTGNDFNDMSRLPRDLEQVAETILQGKTRQVDAGKVTADGRTHYFDNNSAVAMEPMVTLENIHMTRLKGNIRYFAALVKAIMKLKAWQMHITWQDGSYEGPTYLLSVCNSPRTGGVFTMAPGAQMDDGLFDFVLAPEIPKRTVLNVLAKLVRGTHVNHPRVTFGRSPFVHITSEPATPLHADGEMLAEQVRNISYEVLPGKITLLTT